MAVGDCFNCLDTSHPAEDWRQLWGYNPELIIEYGSKTEQFTIEILDDQGNSLNPVRIYTFNAGSNFLCSPNVQTCTGNFSLDYYPDNCYDYKLRIKSKNFCSSVESTQIVNWSSKKTPEFTFYNVITPDGDGQNDTWCFEAKGAKSYTVTIADANHVIFQYSGPVYESSLNCPPWIVPSQNSGTWATYFYNIDLFNPCSSSTPINRQGTITAYYRMAGSNSNSSQVDKRDSTKENNIISKVNNIVAAPNPFSQNIDFTYTLVENATVSLKIINSQGIEVRRIINNQETKQGGHKITWMEENLPAGIYLYCFYVNGQLYTGKIVKIN